MGVEYIIESQGWEIDDLKTENKRLRRRIAKYKEYIKARILEEEANARRVARYGEEPRIYWIVLEELRAMQKVLEGKNPKGKQNSRK